MATGLYQCIVLFRLILVAAVGTLSADVGKVLWGLLVSVPAMLADTYGRYGREKFPAANNEEEALSPVQEYRKLPGTRISFIAVFVRFVNCCQGCCL